MGCRVAVQVSGQPRFIREFKTLIEGLQEYDHIDWFFYLWTSTHATDNRIPPNWRSDDLDWVTNKISKQLLPNQSIAGIKLVAPIEYVPTREYNITPWTSVKDWIPMWTGIKEVNRMRQEYEKLHGPYDLVVRARADVGISHIINCRDTQSYIDQNPTNIIMPYNHRYGLRGSATNDLFAIGNRETMTVYSQVLDYLGEYTDQGIPFTNETMLAHHLNVNGINYPATNLYHLGRGFGNIGKMPEDSPRWTFWGERGFDPDWACWNEE